MNTVHHPHNTDKVTVLYIERTKLSMQNNLILREIVSLTNSEGGRIFIGRKTKTNKVGIPESLREEYENAVRNFIGSIPNFVKDYPMDKIDVGWDHTYSTGSFFVIYVPNYDKTLLQIEGISKYNNGVFIKENGSTVRLGSSNPSIISIIKRVKYKILKPVIPYNGSAKYFLINNPNPLEHAYKYMTMEAFVLSLLNSTWQFAEPTKWSDEYEGRFYRADYSALKVVNCPPKLFATCITGEKASEAAWKVYAHGQGLGAKCVQIKINMVKLRNILSSAIIQKCAGIESVVNGAIYEGTVFYDLNDQDIEKLNTTYGTYYNTFFDNFDTNSFLKLLLIKRKAYEYEKETRLFFVPKDFVSINRTSRSGKGDIMNIKVNWRDIIEEIRIDKNCSEAELETIKYVCKQAGINIHDPKKRGPKKSDEIPLIRFNVDKMEGRKKISISPKKV